MSEELNREQALIEVIRWALGESEIDEFPGLPDDWPCRKFYWRHELRRRFAAALGSRGVPQEAPRGLDLTAIIQLVAELPDRTSPADWPEAMLVTADELAWILTEAELALRGVGTPQEKELMTAMFPTLFTGHPDGIYREISLKQVRGWFTTPEVRGDVATPTALPEPVLPSVPNGGDSGHTPIMEEICPWCAERIGNLKPAGGCLTAEVLGWIWHPQCANEYEAAREIARNHPAVPLGTPHQEEKAPT